MAALDSSAVSLYPTSGIATAEWEEGGQVDKHHLVRRLKLVLTGQGGTSNTIGASALGFSSLLSCSNLWDATNSKVYLAVVDPVNNVILLAATAADTAADVTSTATYITVKGSRKLS